MRIAIVPARGGSKRLPRKNVLPVMGRPALAWPIAAARDSGVFDAIYVSTEDAEIAAAARAAGAEVLDRPPELAGDAVTLPQVCMGALDMLEAQGVRPDDFCCLFATALLLLPEDLAGAAAILDSQPGIDTVLATCLFPMTPLQALREESDGLRPMWPDWMVTSSSLHPPLVGDAGAFFWTRTPVFRRTGHFFKGRLQGWRLPRTRAVDIDTREDMEIAECLLRRRLEGRP